MCYFLFLFSFYVTIPFVTGDNSRLIDTMYYFSYDLNEYLIETYYSVWHFKVTKGSYSIIELTTLVVIGTDCIGSVLFRIHKENWD